jgi:adenylate cyclase class IV
MPDELELKAILPDHAALRARLLAAGAVERFRGRMSDRRYDRRGELAARDEVLRVRSYRRADGRVDAVLGWKGPVQRTPGGYKRRAEIELPVTADATASPSALLTALGYEVVHAIDRDVEVFVLGGATVRLERYPRMDSLLEVEGDPDAIERAIAVSGIPRTEFTADPLAEFVRRFEARRGEPALLAEP